jgi:hypothetical protein
MLVLRSKQAILGNSRAKIHVQLTMWIISQKIGLGQNCEEKNTGTAGDPDTLLQSRHGPPLFAPEIFRRCRNL